jgi:hypothetical protein
MGHFSIPQSSITCYKISIFNLQSTIFNFPFNFKFSDGIENSFRLMEI